MNQKTLYLIFIVLLIGTIIMLWFNLQAYIRTQNALNQFTGNNSCEVCDMLGDIGAIKW